MQRVEVTQVTAREQARLPVQQAVGLHQVEAVKQVGHSGLGQIDAYRKPAQLSLEKGA